jgi:N6-L-threonylcarbamoyladenine synthase
MNILGIETSCDETAAAVVSDGVQVLSSVVASQVAVHRPFGGVVPELASRRHMETIVPVVQQSLDEAGLDLDNIQAVAVTQGPGLVGALLVGFNFARALAFAKRLAWVGVNHLEGHVHALFLEPEPPPYPFVCLLASGGHTGIFHVKGPTRLESMGQTLDDAAGEAFDKVAKALGLGYPGGGIIEKLAGKGDRTRIVFPRPCMDKEGFDFSFSGIKTAVGRYIQTHRPRDDQWADVAAAFQEAVVDVLSAKLVAAAVARNCPRVALVGGVAANGRLRDRIRQTAVENHMQAFLPSPAFCGDNAAMIAAAGFHHLAAGRCGRMEDDVFSRGRL